MPFSPRSALSPLGTLGDARRGPPLTNYTLYSLVKKQLQNGCAAEKAAQKKPRVREVEIMTLINTCVLRLASIEKASGILMATR